MLQMTLNVQSLVKKREISMGKCVAEELGFEFRFEGAEGGQFGDGGWERIEKSWAKKRERSFAI